MKPALFTTAVALLCAGILACSGSTAIVDPGGDTGPGGDADSPGDATEPLWVDLTEAIFAPDRVLEIELDIAPADWDVLRTQTRSLDDILGTNCLKPRTRPFTYFPADVTIDGTLIENVGLRKKGFLGSLDDIRPSLKVKFNEYIGNRYWSGSKRLTLNNCKQDPSFIKQCIGYAHFAALGVPAPRCNFAHVTVNGNDLGIYANVESIRREFLGRHFDDTTGNMYEGALSDFRVDWVESFERKTNKHDPDRTDIESIVDVLALPDNEVLAALEQKIDVDGFIDFWVGEQMIAHWDGYAGNTNNFYFYFDPMTGLGNFIPWGIDAVLQEDQSVPAAAVIAQGALARRLYLLPEVQALYLARLRVVAEEIWNAEEIMAEVDRMEALIRPIADPLGANGLAYRVQEVRDFVRERSSRLIAALDAGTPVWTNPLRDPPCMETIGDVDITFDTTWGTLAAPNPFIVGTGTMTGTVDGVPLTVTSVAAGAGQDPNPELPRPEYVVRVIGTLDDGNVAIVRAVIYDPTLIAPGSSVPFDFSNSIAVVFHYDVPADNFALVGFLMNGSIDFSAGDTVPGAPVTGTIAAEVRRWGM